MTQHDAGVTIRQLLDCASDVLKIAQGRPRPELESNKEFQWALLRGLEILGEAANRLSPDFHRRYPDVPWGNMIGMRNRLIHAYENVNWDAVWIAVHDRIPVLITSLERIALEWPIPED